MRRTQSEQSQPALLRQADLNERCRHFADGPAADIDQRRKPNFTNVVGGRTDFSMPERKRELAHIW